MAGTLSLETKVSPASVFWILNFRLLWIGKGISLLSNQFYLIALPWPVPVLTGNALAVGTVLATAGIPRALFMLDGGALIGLNVARLLIYVGCLMTVFALSAVFSPVVRAGMA